MEPTKLIKSKLTKTKISKWVAQNINNDTNYQPTNNDLHKYYTYLKKTLYSTYTSLNIFNVMPRKKFNSIIDELTNKKTIVKQNKVGYSYFMISNIKDVKTIKIGFTTDMNRRFKSYIKIDCSIIHICESDKEMDKFLQSVLKKYNLKTLSNTWEDFIVKDDKQAITILSEIINTYCIHKNNPFRSNLNLLQGVILQNIGKSMDEIENACKGLKNEFGIDVSLCKYDIQRYVLKVLEYSNTKYKLTDIDVIYLYDNQYDIKEISNRLFLPINIVEKIIEKNFKKDLVI